MRENKVSELFPSTRYDIQKQRKQAREEFINLSGAVKELRGDHARDIVEQQSVI